MVRHEEEAFLYLFFFDTRREETTTVVWKFDIIITSTTLDIGGLRISFIITYLCILITHTDYDRSSVVWEQCFASDLTLRVFPPS